MARVIKILPEGVKISIGRYVKGAIAMYNKNILGVGKLNLYIDYPFEEKYKREIEVKGINSGGIIDSIVGKYWEIAYEEGCTDKLMNMYIESCTLDKKSKDLIVVISIYE